MDTKIRRCSNTKGKEVMNDTFIVVPIFALIFSIMVFNLTYFRLVENTVGGYGLSIILLIIAIGIFYWIYK